MTNPVQPDVRSRGQQPRRPIRVGAVSYLNTKPLIHQFAKFAPQAELVVDVPSRLADELFANNLDVALVPVIELFGKPGYRVLADACIACRGPVLSVKLFSRVPVAEIRTLSLDEGSRTSAALVQILLHARFGIRPELQLLPIGKSVSDAAADAVLLIGDRSIHPPPGPFAVVWDLGEEWIAHTGLPFVFAAWVAQSDTNLAGVEQALTAARDSGIANLEDIAAAEAPKVGLTRAECLAYLRDHLHFYLGEREQQGLERFHELAIQLGLVPPGVGITYCGEMSTPAKL
ncbi:MAG: menaquinone biosynthesis protein [Pirellulales bacterium]|nr:menaquinone biosynthesis protein [Pirellulales bacterium]